MDFWPYGRRPGGGNTVHSPRWDRARSVESSWTPSRAQRHCPRRIRRFPGTRSDPSVGYRTRRLSDLLSVIPTVYLWVPVSRWNTVLGAIAVRLVPLNSVRIPSTDARSERNYTVSRRGSGGSLIRRRPENESGTGRSARENTRAGVPHVSTAVNATGRTTTGFRPRGTSPAVRRRTSRTPSRYPIHRVQTRCRSRRNER